MYTKIKRALNEKDLKLLQAVLKTTTKQKKAIFKRGYIVCLFIILALWGLTLLAVRDISMANITLIWIFIGIPLVIFLGSGAAKPYRDRIAKIERVLMNGRVEEDIIASDMMVEFEEIEDEGACYAFQVEESKIIFICGQEFYPTPKFPCSDFSIIAIYDNNKELIDIRIEKRGSKLHPSRVISAEVKKKFQMPKHLEVTSGKLDELEKNLVVEDVRV